MKFLLFLIVCVYFGQNKLAKARNPATGLSDQKFRLRKGKFYERPETKIFIALSKKKIFLSNFFLFTFFQVGVMFLSINVKRSNYAPKDLVGNL